MRIFIIPALTLAAAVLTTACGPSSDSLQVGGIYSMEDGRGHFGVVKLLAHEDDTCHVRIYKQKFPSRPTKIDVASLSLGSIHDSDGFGAGHLPMLDAGFLDWKPVLITRTPVTPDELKGYRMWKDRMATYTLQ